MSPPVQPREIISNFVVVVVLFYFSEESNNLATQSHYKKGSWEAIKCQIN